VIVALNQSVASDSGRVSIEKENLSFCASVFQAGYSEWLSGVSPKETEIAWDEIRNHSYTRLQQYRHLDHCIWSNEQRKHLRKVPLQQKRRKTLFCAMFRG